MPNKRPKQPLVSIVVPVFNEEESIALFVETTRKVLKSAQLSFEIIFVNDGSVDDTFKCLIKAADDDGSIQIVNLSRNFGKELALTAGIDHCRGDVIIPMDVDLQDPPDLIPLFVERWREGYDVVYGARTSREKDSYSKRASAVGFYRVFNRLANVKIPDDAGDFRLLDRRVADVIRQMPERNRFMKGIFAWAGFRTTSISYERPQRAAGSTKWNYWRLWNLALEGIINFSSTPLRIWTYIGATIALISFSYGAFIALRTIIFGIDLPGYASLMVAILFLGGIQILSIGIIGEYISRIFIEVKARPMYVVDSIYPPEPPSPRADKQHEQYYMDPVE